MEIKIINTISKHYYECSHPPPQPVDPIPLALYKNGFAMFSGPFRSYSDPVNHQFIRDLTDGYFPAELKTKYPKGVPFLVSHTCMYVCMYICTYCTSTLACAYVCKIKVEAKEAYLNWEGL